MGYQLIAISIVLLFGAFLGTACLLLLMRIHAALAGTALQEGWEGVLEERPQCDHVAVARRITAEFARDPRLDDSLEPPQPRSAHGSRSATFAASPGHR